MHFVPVGSGLPNTCTAAALYTMNKIEFVAAEFTHGIFYSYMYMTDTRDYSPKLCYVLVVQGATLMLV